MELLLNHHFPERYADESKLDRPGGDQVVVTYSGPHVGLEEHHQKSKTYKNHNMDVLKHCVHVTHLVRSFDLLSIKILFVGASVENTSLEPSRDSVDDQQNAFTNQEQ